LIISDPKIDSPEVTLLAVDAVAGREFLALEGGVAVYCVVEARLEAAELMRLEAAELMRLVLG